MNQHLFPLAGSNSPGNQLVEISGGEITLRDDRTQRQWTVAISPFLLSIYPVTQELYNEITQASPSVFGGAKHPVESVSWPDAVRFCNALSRRAGLTPCYQPDSAGAEFLFTAAANGYRLPSEAEWEYACKAGTSEPRYGELEEIAWYKANSGKSTQPVGLKQPNAWGLHDMLGNIWEWCADVYDEEVYGAYRIFRGGGWYDEPRSCLATNRRRSHPSFQIDDLGFRVAQNLNPALAGSEEE